MKKSNLAKSVKSLVCYEKVSKGDKKTGLEYGVKIYDFEDVINAGKDAKDLPFEKCAENDFPIFSYTSGTTGDSKGVMLTHKNFFVGGQANTKIVPLDKSDAHISYMPYPHSYE
jgi:long-subunit acyl-CoA synthetase (AMP-forming)